MGRRDGLLRSRLPDPLRERDSLRSGSRKGSPGTATAPVGVAVVGPAVLTAREILLAEGGLLVVAGLAGATSSETPSES